MIAGQKIEKTRFIPFLLSPGLNNFDSVDFLTISQTLGGKAGIPFFIIFTKNPIEFPSNLDGIIEKRIIFIPDVNESLECIFSQFKSLICSIFAISFEKRIYPQIGICCTYSPDILAYIIIRWLIEEKGIPFEEANQYWINSGLPQLTSNDYISELIKLSTVKATPETAPQQKSNEKEYDNLIKILEQTNVDGQNQNQTNPSQVISQPLSTITSKPLSSYELLVRELNIKCKTFLKTIPLFATSILTPTILKQIEESDENEDFAVTLEPSGGQRALLFVQNGEKQIICENNQLIITTDLKLPQLSDLDKEINDTIIEGVFIDTREFRNTFIICDVIMYDSVDLTKMRFDARLGYIFNELFPARKEYKKDKIVRENIKLMVRPVFPYSDFKKLIQRIDSTVPYPVRSVSIGPIFKPWSDKKDITGWYTWVRDPELPVVVISVNYASANIVGMVSTPYGMTKVADLGPLNANLSVFEGSRVHITLDSDLNWKIEGSAEGEEIWSKTKFDENFPNGEGLLTEKMITQILNEN